MDYSPIFADVRNRLCLVARDGEVVQLPTAGAPQSVSIGRTAPCELVLADDPDTSRRHARVFWNGSSWTLEDMGSSNGTFIGEFQTERKLAAPTTIRDGEIFRVGRRACGWAVRRTNVSRLLERLRWRRASWHDTPPFFQASLAMLRENLL